MAGPIACADVSPASPPSSVMDCSSFYSPSTSSERCDIQCGATSCKFLWSLQAVRHCGIYFSSSNTKQLRASGIRWSGWFLFWEYFVISRSYVLLALIGFAFVALRQHRSRQDFIPWLLLGLLANVHLL